MLKTIWDISNDDFIKFVNESNTYSDLLRKCGYTNLGNNKTVKKRIILLNLSIEHFIKNTPPINIKKPLNDILIENITLNNTNLKKRLIKELNWEYKCSECNISKWNEKDISLELDHINGNNTNNKINNLRLLCPNCHSQTPTFRAKNKIKVESRQCNDCNENINKTNKSGYCSKCIPKHRKPLKDKPSLETLENDFKELKTYTAVGKKHNVSDNCIRNWIRKYNQEPLS